ncbi:MAG TPA: TIR domain-containing protein [Leptolyngbyaceae cyanobacterium]
MTDVFISYSRKDKEFVQVLHRALTESQYETWVDWEDIPLTADWWEEIKAGIDAADTFLFVITPDSIASKVCGDEVDHAVTNHKRLVPIVRREGFDMTLVRPALGRHNWLFFRENDDFQTALQSLVQALDTDLEHVKSHTRLLVRAREWEKKDRHADYLLRGRDIEEAEDWLAHGQGKQPYPSELHRDYISSSRKAETLSLQQEQQRLRLFLGVVTGLAAVSLVLAGFALAKRREAIAQREEAYAQARVAFAHQLIADAQPHAQEKTLTSPQTTSLANLQQRQVGFEPVKNASNTEIAFGLATLPPNKAKLLANVEPQLVVLSKSKRFIAALTRDRTVWAWNLETRKTVLQAKPASMLVDLDFSPNDQLLTATTEEGELRLWRVSESKYDLVAVLPGHGSPLTDSSFSPDGRYLATASLNGMAKIWDIPQIEQAASLSQKQPIAILRHPQAIRSILISPSEPNSDQLSVITGSEDKTVRVWTLTGQQQLCISHDHPVYWVGFNDSGHYLGSVSGNSQVHMWRWPELMTQPSQFIAPNSGC